MLAIAVERGGVQVKAWLAHVIKEALLHDPLGSTSHCDGGLDNC